MRASASSSQFQSTLSVRRATRHGIPHAFQTVKISIHALRKESDQLRTARPYQRRISIHALRKESDLALCTIHSNHHISIHALRKESDDRCRPAQMNQAISIHALRKESDRTATRHTPTMTISIHALRKESDRSSIYGGKLIHLFQSTLSVRRATQAHRTKSY